MARVVQHLKKTTLTKPPPKRNEHTSLDTFVDSKVILIDRSREYLAKMFPYYPREVVCVSAFLTLSQLSWKINWHWELLVAMARIALDMGVGKDRAAVERIIHRLDTVAPSPRVGYVDSPNPGDPADSSADELIKRRHGVLMTAKTEFKAILGRSGLRKKLLKFRADSPLIVRTKPSDWWQHAVNIVDPPEKSSHGTGYGFDLGFADLKLNTLERRVLIENISLALGCVFRNDENTHVHVDFPNGVKG